MTQLLHSNFKLTVSVFGYSQPEACTQSGGAVIQTQTKGDFKALEM